MYDIIDVGVDDMTVELGFELDKEIEYYEEMLKEHGCENFWNGEAHDTYYTTMKLDNMSENEMKNACIRLRKYRKYKSDEEYNKSFQNLKLLNKKENTLPYSENILKEINDNGYELIFDTKKTDIHYKIPNCNGDIQLQDVEGIGLLLYYYNEDYKDLSLQEQRKLLIDELNSVGFSFDYNKVGLDNLRTLFYKEKKYSLNQNA